MKKILFVIPTMRMGGAEKSLVTLLNSIEPDKYEIDLLLFESGGVLQADVPEWVNIYAVDKLTRGMVLEFKRYGKDILKSGHPCAFLQRFLLSVKRNPKRFSWNRIKKYIPMVEKEYDVAISYLEGTTAFFVLDKVVAHKKIGWIHTNMSGRCSTGIEKEYYCRFDSLATITDICRDVFVDIIPELKNKMYVLPNMVSQQEIELKARRNVDTSSWNHGKTHIVSVGRLEVQKGMDIAIEACNKLVSEDYPICWHVYGEGSQKEVLDDMILKRELKDYFILEGMVPNPYPYMKLADIIVQPSRCEGKSIVLDEAKLLGKAIVVTRYESVADQIEDEQTGLIVDINSDSVAEGVKRLINDPILRQYLENECLNTMNTQSDVLQKFYSLIDD